MHAEDLGRNDSSDWVLSVHISNYLDRWRKLDKHWLQEKYLPRCLAYCHNLRVRVLETLQLADLSRVNDIQ
jgi:hypothetical protein